MKTGFVLIRVGIVMHGSLCNETYLVSKDPIKLNNARSTCLIGHNINLYYSLALNACECLICYSLSIAL